MLITTCSVFAIALPSKDGRLSWEYFAADGGLADGVDDRLLIPADSLSGLAALDEDGEGEKSLEEVES